MMKRIYLLICITAAAWTARAQQDPQYNLYQFNPLILNPSYAGAKDALSIIASTRQQWVGFAGAPKTTCLSVHAPLLNKHLGLGFTAVNDIIGARNVISFHGNVAYILKINRKVRLSFGVNGGYEFYQFNIGKISFSDPTDNPGSQNIDATQNKGALDVNAGVFLRSNQFFVGLSSTHINRPGIYDYKTDTSKTAQTLTAHLSTHLFLTAGYSFKVNEDVIFAPTIMAKQVNGVVSMDFNANFFLYKKLWLGAFYRSGYGPGALIQYYVTKQFKVAYSYDTGLSDARRLGGSHEIMLGFDFSAAKNRTFNPRFL